MKPYLHRLIVIAGLLSLACTTRVSEWVLLNALPEQYSLIYFHSSPLTEPVISQNKAFLKKAEKANIRFRTVNRKDIKDPYWGLYYEDRLFSTFRNSSELNSLVNSPLREKIAAELMEGKLCVMVYLKTDDPEKDARGMATLRTALSSSPFGKIITVAELSRNSKEEAHFASLLLNVEDDLKSIQEPMLFGVFGKFKALEPLLGRGITEENIRLMISYLTAECSCLIKDDLPGTDILFSGSWDNPKPALLNKIIDENPALGK